MRDPRGYILPADQPDFPTATKFINTLIKNGVHGAAGDEAILKCQGKHYPADSWVVKSGAGVSSARAGHVRAAGSSQRFQYPGGPPIPPYDVTGYTLAFQMGVQFDRILEGFDGPFERVERVAETRRRRRLRGPAQPAGYLISHQLNDSFMLVNRLLKNGDEVYWLENPVTGRRDARRATARCMSRRARKPGR